jgi:serine/threonine protein kinase
MLTKPALNNPLRLFGEPWPDFGVKWRHGRQYVQKFGTMIDSSPPPAASPEPSVVHSDALAPGARLNEFEISSLLGVGGFGMVYRAYDHSLHRAVAIKEYMPSALAGRSAGLTVSIRSSADQPTFMTGLRSFVSEARLLAQFDHPSLGKVYRFWEANNTAYMVMPLYSGMTLRQARSLMQSPPPEAWLRQVLWSILEALKYLHQHNTVHRDVSPDNIFLQDVGPPVLLDLGAARRAISDKSQKHTAILKVNYAPIEQYADSADMRQGPWTDLYSLAAVVHGCLCNEAPLPATFRVLRDRMPTFASVAQTVQTHFGHSYSPEFVRALGHALAIQPQDRPQSVQAFCDEMALSAPQDILRFAWREGFADLKPPSHAETATAVTQPHTTRAESPGAAQPRTQAPADSAGTWPVDLDSSSLTSDSLFPDTAFQVPAASAQAGTAPSAVKKGLIAAAAFVLLAGLAVWGLRSPSPESSGPPPLAQMPLQAKEAVVTTPSEPGKLPQAKFSPGGVVPPPSPAARPVDPKKPGLVSSKPSGPEPGKAKSDQADVATASRLGSPAVRRGPAEVCANSNFLTRPMCIHQECEKPEFTALAICVENRKRLQENTRQNSP